MDNITLSPKANQQLERMIDDASFATYPLHLFLGGLRLVLYSAVVVVALVLGVIYWSVTAKQAHSSLTRDFSPRQDVVLVNFNQTAGTAAPFTTTVKHLDTSEIFGSVTVNDEADLKANLSKFMSYCDSKNMKNLRWDADYRWLSDKSDAMLAAYIAGARNIDALRLTLASLKSGQTVPAFQGCSATTGSAAFLAAYPGIVIPDAPVVVASHVTNISEMQAAAQSFGALGNWMTGICIADHCTKEDFRPRNTSIWADLFHPQMTDGQQEAINALNGTGTAKFWINAAHANNIVGHDAEIEAMAAINADQVRTATTKRHTADDHDVLFVQVSIALAILALFLMFLYVIRTVIRMFAGRNPISRYADRKSVESFDRKLVKDGLTPEGYAELLRIRQEFHTSLRQS